MSQSNLERLLGRIDQHVENLSKAFDTMRDENNESHKVLNTRIGELENLFTRMDERTGALRQDLMSLNSALGQTAERLNTAEKNIHHFQTEKAVKLQFRHYLFVFLTSGIGVLCIELLIGAYN